MELVTSLGLIGAVAGSAAFAGHRLKRDRNRARSQFLSRADEVIDVSERRIMRSGYDSVCGGYAGLSVAVTPIVDTLTVRKLPALWIVLTIQTPLPLGATIDLMMRATGLESFSRFHDLPDAVPTPDGFPAEASIRSDDRALLPALDPIGPHLALFRDGIGKELLVTPNGLRFVGLAAEADRGSYLIFRDARFAVDVLDPAKLKAGLDMLVAIRESLLATRDYRAAA